MRARRPPAKRCSQRSAALAPARRPGSAAHRRAQRAPTARHVHGRSAERRRARSVAQRGRQRTFSTSRRTLLARRRTGSGAREESRWSLHVHGRLASFPPRVTRRGCVSRRHGCWVQRVSPVREGRSAAQASEPRRHERPAAAGQLVQTNFPSTSLTPPQGRSRRRRAHAQCPQQHRRASNCSHNAAAVHGEEANAALLGSAHRVVRVADGEEEQLAARKG